ncbi:hypothetical protein [Luteimonas changyuni]|uniref:hypothetical protein n=1 Tax=Luteimonas sp. MJ145 TaxID=3129234 RepID=UPI0031BB611E
MGKRHGKEDPAAADPRGRFAIRTIGIPDPAMAHAILPLLFPGEQMEPGRRKLKSAVPDPATPSSDEGI